MFAPTELHVASLSRDPESPVPLQVPHRTLGSQCVGSWEGCPVAEESGSLDAEYSADVLLLEAFDAH